MKKYWIMLIIFQNKKYLFQQFSDHSIPPAVFSNWSISIRWNNCVRESNNPCNLIGKIYDETFVLKFQKLFEYS